MSLQDVHKGGGGGTCGQGQTTFWKSALGVRKCPLIQILQYTLTLSHAEGAGGRKEKGRGRGSAVSRLLARIHGMLINHQGMPTVPR